jgi:hypothetical protein
MLLYISPSNVINHQIDWIITSYSNQGNKQEMNINSFNVLQNKR